MQSVKVTAKFKQMEKMMTGMMGMLRAELSWIPGLPGMGGAEGNPMGLKNGFRNSEKRS